ncbi:MAG: T9SS type A sorting domain-containing protein [Chitinophagales bacterium]
MKVFLRILCVIVLFIVNNPIVLAQKTWTGASDTNWANASNWSPVGIPASTDNVFIPNVTNSAVLQNGTTASIKALSVQANAVLTIQTNAVLNIDGSTNHGIENAATLNNAGEINIGGSAAVVTNGIANNGGTFTNQSSGVINIGGGAAIGGFGIRNLSTFVNEINGTINIDQTGGAAFINEAGHLINKSKLNIGQNTTIQKNGIVNAFNSMIVNEIGGVILIDRAKLSGILTTSSSTFTNKAIIRIGSLGVIGNQGIENLTGAIFTNDTGSEINIDQTNSNGITNDASTFVNKSVINIGATTSIGGFGIRNLNTFVNEINGTINIDQTGGAAFINEAGHLTNKSKLNIGQNTTVQKNGIVNAFSSTIINEIGGVILIDRAKLSGILTTSSSTFTNKAIIRIGSLGAIGNHGIENLTQAIFTNDTGAKLHINQVGKNGILNYVSSAFTNKGDVHIGGISTIGNNGIENITDAVFTNDTGANIHIDRTNQIGLANNDADFINKANIYIGGVATIGTYGLYSIIGASFINEAGAELHIDQTNSDGIFNYFSSPSILNKACAKIFISEKINGDGIFTNSGFLFSDFNGSHINIGTFTNQGTIEDLQGAFDGVSMNNEDLIVAPVCGNVVIPNVLQIGTNNSFTVSTDWYSDVTLTTDVGDYDQNSNTFTSTLLAGNHTLYMEITDDNNPSCKETVAIQVNLLDFSIAGDLTYCNSEGNTLLDAGNWTNYLWSNNSTSQTIEVTGGTYSVTVTSAIGCTSTDEVNVVSHSIPSVNLEGTGMVTTTNSTGNHVYVIEVCGGTSSYEEDFTTSGGFCSVEEFPSENAGCINYQIVYGNGVSWSLTVTDVNACQNQPLTFTSDEIPSDSLPQIVNYTVSPETCVGEENGSISIEVEGGDDNCNQYTYIWSSTNGFSTTVVGTTTGNTANNLASGFYDVIVTDCAGTSVTESMYVNRTNSGSGRGRGRGGCKTAGDELNDLASLKAFPNPFGQITSIEFSIASTSKVWISVYSIEGRKVAEILNGENIEGNTPQRLGFDAEELQNGVYILELQTESGLRQHQQLVIMK